MISKWNLSDAPLNAQVSVIAVSARARRRLLWILREARMMGGGREKGKRKGWMEEGGGKGDWEKGREEGGRKGRKDGKKRDSGTERKSGKTVNSTFCMLLYKLMKME